MRLYMKGNDGTEWYWCGGFVCFVLHQACESLKVAMPIPGSFSCDELAAQARAAGLFLSEVDAPLEGVPPGCLFLVRRTQSDWTHVGIVVEADETAISTIEGNTNDEGHRDGYEVCTRTRSYDGKDFVLLS